MFPRATNGPRNYADPYAYYRALRATDPVRWNDSLSLWTLTGYEDIAAALIHPYLSSKRAPPNLTNLNEEARENASVVYGTIGTWLLRSDPPEHTRLRRIGAPALRGCVARSARERIQQTADDLLDRVVSRRGMEVIADFAAPLSLDAIASIVGVPDTEHRRFCAWAGALGGAAESSPDARSLKSAVRSLSAASGYLRQLVRERTDHPADDLLSALMRNVKGERLDTEEIIGLSTLLLLAGHATTTHLIGNGILALLQNTDQFERLRVTPSLFPAAVQELLRYASPLHGILRTAARDLDLGATHIRKSESVVIWLAAGNRDPARFHDPERLDIGRTPNPHLGFGHGIHHCFGALLGELVTEVAIARLVQRFPHLRLADHSPEWQGNFLFRGQRSLHLLF
jgi:cytochrome P450